MEVAGFGTTIGSSATANGSFTLFAKLQEITPPEIEAGDIDTTHHQTTGGHRTFQAGLSDSGDAEIECIYTAAAYTAAYALYRLDKFFKITYPDGSTDTFAGYVKKIGKAVELDGLTTFKVGMKVSGEVTHAAAA